MAPRARIVSALAAIAILGIAPASAAADCADQDRQAEELSEFQIETSITCLINERRTESGRPGVRENSRLRHAAANHSQSMVSGGFFSHDSPNGSSFVDRIEASGYMRGARSWLVGENLVWGNGELSTPANLVKAWMESPAHRANLLRGRFKEVGVGVKRGTPSNSSEQNGVTVSSEYGFRAGNRRAGSARKRG
jgi:uncharacterized protein YkwD